jgi:hypothetical protein
MRLDAATLETVRHGLQLVRLAMFAVFVTLGVRVMLARGPGRRRAINHLLVYTLLAHLAIIVPQNEAWPFAMYPMMSTNATPRAALHSGFFFEVVDQDGRAWRVDELAWSPLFPQAVMGWFEVSWARATPAQRDEVLCFLLRRAENARLHRRAGHRFFGNAALLGPLAAPDTNLWGHAPQSPSRLRTLRLYRISWIPTVLAREGRVAGRAVIAEVRE